MKKADLVVLFGGTGNTGFHTANALLDRGYAVRIVVRSRQKVTQLFKQKQISFQKIIEGPLNNPDVLKQAFKASQNYGRVKYAVSTLGYKKSKESVEQVQFNSQARIIDQCKQAKIQKYILVSTIYMEKPWKLIAVLLNTFVPDVYIHKSRAQNYLRKSGLNYAIIRPPGLIGDTKNVEVNNYKLDQGDNLSGSITRCTLGNIIRDVLDSNKIPSKATFQCTSIPKQSKDTGLSFEQLKEDTEKNIVTANHKTPKYVYGFTFCTTVALGTYLFASKFFGNGQA